MYFVPDGTKLAGFYGCDACGYRFLSVQVGPSLICPNCGKEVDMEIGPDEEMPKTQETAKLIEVVRDDDVEKYDILLSNTLCGGDEEAWM